MPAAFETPVPATAPRPRVSFFEPLLLIVSIGLSVLGAIIGMQLIVSLGISANTSIIGALIAIVFSRIPLQVTRRFRVLERQNLVQTAISSATFGAANSLMIPLGVPFAMGMPELVTPMLIGSIAAMLVDGAMLYNLFGSKIFPVDGHLAGRRRDRRSDLGRRPGRPQGGLPRTRRCGGRCRRDFRRADVRVRRGLPRQSRGADHVRPGSPDSRLLGSAPAHRHRGELHSARADDRRGHRRTLPGGARDSPLASE